MPTINVPAVALPAGKSAALHYTWLQPTESAVEEALGGEGQRARLATEGLRRLHESFLCGGEFLGVSSRRPDKRHQLDQPADSLRLPSTTAAARFGAGGHAGERQRRASVRQPVLVEQGHGTAGAGHARERRRGAGPFRSIITPSSPSNARRAITPSFPTPAYQPPTASMRHGSPPTLPGRR